jgi:hypothetical protein
MRRKNSLASPLYYSYYVWGGCREQNILIPVETKLKSFNEILIHYFGEFLEVSDKFIEFNDLFFYDGYYERDFNEIEKIGAGSYGTVFMAFHSGFKKEFAVKKICLKQQFKCEILREFNNFCWEKTIIALRGRTLFRMA